MSHKPHETTQAEEDGCRCHMIDAPTRDVAASSHLGVSRRGFALPAGLALAEQPVARALAGRDAEAATYDPVPATAKGPSIPSKGYLVQLIGAGLYYLTDGVYQMMFLTIGQGVIAVDAPPTIGHNILRAIGEVTSEPVTHVNYSHVHADHIGAAVLYPHDAVRIAHTEMARLLRRVNDPNRPLPTRTFKDHYTLRAGDLPFLYSNPTSGKSGEYNKSVPIVIEEEAPGVRLTFESYSSGNHSDAAMASLLNQQGYRTRNKAAIESRTGRVRNPHHLWTKHAVTKLLKNPFFTGQVRYKGDLHQVQHPAIIDAELYQQCQEQRARRMGEPKRNAEGGRRYLLAGIITCAGCGEPMRSTLGSSQRTLYYRCAAAQRGLTCTGNARSLRCEQADDLVGALVGRLTLPADWRQSILQRLAESDAAREAIERRSLLERKLAPLKQMYKNLELERSEYEAVRDSINDELAKLVIPEATDLTRAGEYLEHFGELWATANPENLSNVN